jgi:hypothetical protein
MSDTVLVAQTGSPKDPCEALGGCVKGIETFNKGDSGSNIVDFILAASRYLTFIAAAVAIFFIVLGGYRMVTANGDDAQYKKGIQTLIWAVGGLVITIIAYTIVAVVTNIIPNIRL